MCSAIRSGSERRCEPKWAGMHRYLNVRVWGSIQCREATSYCDRRGREGANLEIPTCFRTMLVVWPAPCANLVEGKARFAMLDHVKL